MPRELCFSAALLLRRQPDPQMKKAMAAHRDHADILRARAKMPTYYCANPSPAFLTSFLLRRQI